MLAALVVCPAGLVAQIKTRDAAELQKFSWSTDSTGPERFVSVHGRRAAIFGYSQDGLECWAYPFQIVSSLKVSFRPLGTATEIDGQSVLRRIVYSPESVTRVYVGPDFLVKERLFVPPDEPGAIIGYEVAGSRPIDIVVRFDPVLDLMWPAGIGGQEAIWNAPASAYVLSEPRHRFSGVVGSPDIVAHDETQNQNRRLGRESGLAFMMRAGGGHAFARVVIAGGPERTATMIAQKLLQQEDSLMGAAVAHYSTFLNTALRIETPDEDVNRALAWSEIALDQAWVCNPDLGCGLVAGYGPSRKARRPQYDWFFAGDGMVDLPALLDSGQFERARDELEFILKYQDPKTGMVWHELAQSAGWLDWKSYPYMFVHVELTFDFLSAVANYFSATGDRHFVETHWPAIQAAYDYCRSLIDPRDGLPRIPPEREGSREQDSLNEELALSASWIAALQSYGELATATGHNQAAVETGTIRRRIMPEIGKHYWNDGQNFWITGYTRSGAPLSDREIGPVDILSQGLLSEAQREAILEQLATPDFRADWGVRGRAANSSTYDPNSYANGSVWATGTSRTAVAFWAGHRPATAFQIWHALVPWTALDSLGHMHETLAGDYYHQEFESVPEQTWSSATFFEAAVNGLLGLQADSLSNHVTFAPHLPPSWYTITIRHLRVRPSEINLKLITSAGETRLEMQNEGASVDFSFVPEIPLGAKLGRVQLRGRSISAALEPHAEDIHARVEFTLPHGVSVLTIEYVGGVAIESESPPAVVGNSSQAIKITSVQLRGPVYTVDVSYQPRSGSTLEIRTPWRVNEVQGATFKAASPGWYELTIADPTLRKQTHEYHNSEIRVKFIQ